MRRFILEGVARYRLEEAIRAYANGEVDLSAAARHAGVSVYQMMTELERRDIAPKAVREKFLAGLETLAESFGGSEALLRTIARMRQQEDEENTYFGGSVAGAGDVNGNGAGAFSGDSCLVP